MDGQPLWQDDSGGADEGLTFERADHTCSLLRGRSGHEDRRLRPVRVGLAVFGDVPVVGGVSILSREVEASKSADTAVEKVAGIKRWMSMPSRSMSSRRPREFSSFTPSATGTPKVALTFPLSGLVAPAVARLCLAGGGAHLAPVGNRLEMDI